ncbi:MAG: cytidine deaminase [Bacteroidetes bacterium]|jgi:cytidine deaminase|nr:cytidine deaminase [Bacteroidota bacterium]
MQYRTLVSRARAAKRHSHSPYSRFRVGAAVLAASGKVYTGCNIENSSYGLTVCAERTALFKAVSEGEKSFVAVAIASDETSSTPPCGACRQVIMDLAGDIDVILSTSNGSFTVMKASDLLPHPFGGENLKNVRRTRR